VFPSVKAAEARERRDEARKLLVAGIYPSELRKEERAAGLDDHVRQDAVMRFTLETTGRCRRALAFVD
jgi:hypothetical protein